VEYLVLVAVYGDRDDFVLLLAVECRLTLREDAGTLLRELSATKLVRAGRRTALYPNFPALRDIERVLPVLVNFVNGAHYS